MEQSGNLHGKKVLLGVSGSIAAYKAIEILRRLRDSGADVRVVMTGNAERFVSRLTFETLSGHAVPSADFGAGDPTAIEHIDSTNALDVALVAPATANIIGKIAAGIADDALTTAVTALDCPLLIAPAMNDRMYRNQIVQKNISFLKGQGVRFIEPATGALACGTTGQGRLVEIETVMQSIRSSLSRRDMSGVTVLVTAGPTREPIDAVRYISNPSSGKMGYAIAAAARDRGATVVLISGPTQIAPPAGITVIQVTSADQMYKAVMDNVQQADVLIMAAAVSDFKPSLSSDRKIKKEDAPTTIHLDRTQDILYAVGRLPGKRVLVGFAAETDDLSGNALRKLKNKNLDLIVANDILKKGAAFECDTNAVTVIDRTGTGTELPLMQKLEIAGFILDKIVQIRKN